MQTLKQTLIPSGKQWCSQCRTQTLKAGGGWVRVSLLRQRFVCKSCLERLLGAKVA
jgi:transposase-like protein